MSKNKLVQVFNKAELEKMNTKQLMAYISRLRACEESFERSDMEINPDQVNNDMIFFKNTQKWKNAYKMVKEILDNREHVKNWKRK